jgi:hypothetical protein
MFLGALSLLSFYPVLYVLATVHKNRGFEIVITIFTILTTIIYKVTLAFDISELFLPQDSWHKLYSISLLIQFCSLIIYLGRLPKYLQGYVLGIGTCLIIVMQEKDSFSFKFALVPLIFNNFLLIWS